MSIHKYSPEDIEFLQDFATKSGKALGELFMASVSSNRHNESGTFDPAFSVSISEIKGLCDVVGYGHFMAIISALWRRSLKSSGAPISGAFVPALMADIIDVNCSYEAECFNYDKLVSHTLDK